jgi:hypothetical protein
MDRFVLGVAAPDIGGKSEDIHSNDSSKVAVFSDQSARTNWLCGCGGRDGGKNVESLSGLVVVWTRGRHFTS